MSTNPPKTFIAWTAHIFGLPKGATSPQKEVSEAEAVESFVAWCGTTLDGWKYDVRREASQRDTSKTGKFRDVAVDVLDETKTKLESSAKQDGDKAPMLKIRTLLEIAERDISGTGTGISVEPWMEWTRAALKAWAADADKFWEYTERG